MKRIAVVAGTNIDTQMGVDYIRRRADELKEDLRSAGVAGIEAVYCPVTETCDDQVKFQYFDDASKRARIDEVFVPEVEMGTRDFFIYCNSLSGAFDFDSYAAEKQLNIVTPLQVYRQLGKCFGRVGVMCANNISAYGIEKALMEANPDIYMIGSGNMSMVHAIEERRAPSDIIKKCGVDHLVRYMETCGSEAIILGCTHFPYLKEEIKNLTHLEIIDPADMMFEKLTGMRDI